MLQPNPILSLPTRDQSRLSGYQVLLDFYQGLQWPGREKLGEKRLIFNYAKIFVDKITSYLMSGVNFTVEAVEDVPEARAAAEVAEKALARVYESNNLMQLEFETETDCAILGDACYKVVWDEATGDVKVTAPDIQGIYAWWLGDDISNVWRVASKYSLSAEEVEMLYGSRSLYPFSLSSKGESKRDFPFPHSKLITYNSPSSHTDSKLVTVVELWTSSTFELYLDGLLIDQKPNPYGFIPFVIFPMTVRAKVLNRGTPI